MTDLNNRVGNYIKNTIGEEEYYSYVPVPLPFSPDIDKGAIEDILQKANFAIGRLDGMASVLPDILLFLYMYVRKEALLSSQIEGTQSSLSDLLQYENHDIAGIPLDDVQEVSCYIKALDYGLNRLESLPLSLRLLREMHEKLMQNARGADKQPGEFRRSQNWIGGSRPGKAKFVPPPVDYLDDCLDNFEKFLHNDNMPILVKAAIAHVQFETIHPFLDGNGRLGRMLITLILYHDGFMQKPLLYLSLYLKNHRTEYYELLQSVRETGSWEDWLTFFLTGVVETAEQVTDTASRTIALFDTDMKTLQDKNCTKTVLNLYRYLQTKPIVKTSDITAHLGVSLPTVLRSVDVLQRLGIVKEITGNERHKIFTYHRYLSILQEGTEPL